MNTLPAWLQVQYPFALHSQPTEFGDLNYIDEGVGDGPCLVCVHGNPTWSFYWRNIILGLRGQRRCLAMDHLGCGLSAMPQRAPYTLQMHIDNTLALLARHVEGPVHLLAHDWGGAIAMGVAAAMPERVAALTLLNTAAFPFPSIPLRIAVCRWPVIGRILVRGFNGFVRAAGTMTTVEPLPEAVRAAYAFPYDSWRNRVAIHRFVKDIPMRRGHPSYATLARIAGSLSQWEARGIPLTILWGMQDWCFHAGILAEWERRWPSATVKRLEGVGHYVTEEGLTSVLECLEALA